MRVTLRFEDRTYSAQAPPPGAPAAEVPALACPHCGEQPLRAAGRGIRETTHDTYVADAACQACGGAVGTLRAQVDTIFGIEEDERVLHGRARVY